VWDSICSFSPYQMSRAVTGLVFVGALRKRILFCIEILIFVFLRWVEQFKTLNGI
jgi:hypothetical protein